MTIELRDREKPEGKPVCIGSQEISLFLENEDTTVNIPLTCNDTVVGMIKFETFSQKEAVSAPVDSKYPHVKQGCVVCKDTHKGPAGAMYKCSYCVCIKCNGTGTNFQKKTPCTSMKIM